jgi:hypothetical protein
MVLEVTLSQNSIRNIVTKFEVSIFKNDEVREGEKRGISWLRGNVVE